MSELWNTILFQPLINALFALYRVFGNMGVAIVFLTVFIRVCLIPLTAPSLKAQKRMAELGPEIERLKKKYSGDKQGFAKAQMELYRQKGVNPAAGCLPMIVQFVILIALYQAFIQVLRPNGVEVITKLNELLYPIMRLSPETQINLHFLYLDLVKPDIIKVASLPLPGIFLILAALAQFLSSKMMYPVSRVVQEEARQTKEKTDDMVAMMQKQMLYFFPLMTIFIGYAFPSGLVLYWFIFSAFQFGQQYFMTGWGGLAPWVAKLSKNEK